MKNKSNFLVLSTFFGGLLFNYLFWTERLALNLLIYSLYILTITYFNKDITKSYKFKIYATAHLLAAILVVINNSDLTIVTYYISLILFVGFSHYPQIRTVFTAVIATALQFITLPFNFIQSLATVSIGKFNLKPILKFAKYVFIPIIIVTFFTVIYMVANEVFAHYVDTFVLNISNFLGNIFSFFFKDITLVRFLHFCLGAIVTGGLVFTFFNHNLEKAESKCTEKLDRIRKDPNRHTIWREMIQIFSPNLLTKKLALKTEYITGIISFVALNLLLLSVNLIDITTLWLGYKPSGNFSADLHQGTNALIFSIIMAMAVILYFFRGNLNFYSKSKTLKVLAFAWMIQNFILIISVFIRDGYYIEYQGLTHKRIGVLVFAILCIIGLTTVYIKVAKQKTLFYLFKINGHIWFALLLVFSTINWDVLIAKYNINHTSSSGIDLDYLFSLSDKTLPILDKNRSNLYATSIPDLKSPKAVLLTQNDKFQRRLDRRIGYFAERYQKTTWLSWNYRDWQTHQYLIKNRLQP
ncbi:DUF4153 domain-containing protein [Pedobacter hiemivivus]|uniref:DUF4173 domain-containing protein n=1 Tax=Pedobacter hiemivivus TaxID=2530454 RepID=A0A4R0N7M6_9SPHI|nr:DUF4173 domain-containing protein [Pedobacter hiemivivus]TCC96101.1 DUF4173 domain-containing protein [Pedobacter hiemivivus]